MGAVILFFAISLNKQLNKQSGSQLFDTTKRSRDVIVLREVQ